MGASQISLLLLVWLSICHGGDYLGGLAPFDGSSAEYRASSLLVDSFTDNNLTFVLNDSGCDQSHATTQSLTQLTDFDVIGFVGLPCTMECRAVGDIGTFYQKPIISSMCTYDLMSDKSQFPFFLRSEPPFQSHNDAISKFIMHFGWTRVGILFESVEPYISAMENFQRDMSSAGLETLSVPFLSEDGPALSVQTLIDDSITIVVYAMSTGSAQTAFLTAAQYGMTGLGYLWLCADSDLYDKWWASDDAETESALLAAGLYQHGCTIYIPPSQAYTDFNDLYLTTYGETPTRREMLYYDSLTAFLRAVARLREDNRDVRDGYLLLDTLKNTTFDGVTGPYRFDENLDRSTSIAITNFKPSSDNTYVWEQVAVYSIEDDNFSFISDVENIFMGNTTNVPFDRPIPVSYVLGVLVPEDTELGRNVLNGLNLAHDEISRFMEGRPVDPTSESAPLGMIQNRFAVTLDIRDTQCDALLAIQEAATLYEEHAMKSSVTPLVAYLGAGCDDACLVLGKDVNWRVPQLSYSCQAIQLSNKIDYPYFLRGGMSSIFVPAVWMDLILSHGWDRVSLLYTNDEPYAGEMIFFSELLALEAIDIVYSGSFPPGEDPRSHIQEIKERASSIIFYAMAPADLQLTFLAAGEEGMDVKGTAWIGHGQFDGKTWYQSVNPVRENAIIQAASCMIGVASGDFGERYNTWEDRYQQRTSPMSNAVIGSLAYDAVYAATLAVDKIISDADGLVTVPLNGDEVLAKLQNTSFMGSAWDFRFNLYGDRLLPVLVRNWFDGDWQTVANISISEESADALYAAAHSDDTDVAEQEQVRYALSRLEWMESRPLYFHGCTTDVPPDDLPAPYVHLAAFLPMHWISDVLPKMHSVSPQHLAAVVMALDEINNKTDGIRDHLLPNTIIRFTWRDTFNLDDMSAYVAEEAPNMFGGAGADVVLASYFSSDSIAIQNVLQLYSIPQVGYASTWAELSDVEKYPFFTRVVPSDGFMGAALADTLANEPFNFKRVSVLSTDNMRGSTAREYFVDGADQYGVSIVRDIVIDATDPHDAIVDALQEFRTVGTHINIALLDEDTAPIWTELAMEMLMMGGTTGYVWFATDEILTKEGFSKMANSTGVFFTSFCRTMPQNSCDEEASGDLCYDMFLERYYELEDFCTPVGDDIEPTETTTTTDSSSFITTSNGTVCSCDTRRDDEGRFLYITDNSDFTEVTGTTIVEHECVPFTTDGAFDTFTPFLYDAIYFIAEALHEIVEVQKETEIVGAVLKEVLLDTSFNGTTGTVELQRTPMGDRVSEACYDVFQMTVRYIENRIYLGSYVGKWKSSSSFTRCEVSDSTTKGDAASSYICQEDLYWPTVNNTRPSEYCPDDDYYLDPYLVCRPCEEGTHSYLPDMLYCSSCGYEDCPNDDCRVGEHYNGTECRYCDEGWYASQPGETKCVPCAPGTYAKKEGLAICSECDLSYYAVDYGTVQCTRCPDHSIRPARNSSGIAKSECLCEGGYYIVYTSEDPDDWYCAPCPNGASCAGELQPPVNIDGYWGDKDYPTEFWECPNAEACLANFQCEEGRVGRMCGTCADDFHAFGDQCVECQDNESGRVLLTLSGIGGVVLTWILVNKIAASSYDSIDLLLLYLQLASIIFSFHLRWAEDMSISIQSISVINFDVDYVSPSCIVDWDYSTGVYVQLLLPLFYSLCVVSVHTIRVLWQRKSFFDSVDNLVQDVLSFLDVTYHTMCTKSMEVFMCRELLDGSSMLVWGPTVTCYTEQHTALMAVGALGVIVYAFGVPAIYGYILYRGHRDKLLSKPEFFDRYSFLYARYESKYLWWHFVIILRRLLFVVIRVFAYEDPLIQAGIATLILVGMNTIHMYARPFIDDRLDAQEATTVSTLLVLLYCGVFMYSNIDVAEASVIARISIICNVIVAFSLMSFDTVNKVRRHVSLAALSIAEHCGAAFLSQIMMPRFDKDGTESVQVELVSVSPLRANGKSSGARSLGSLDATHMPLPPDITTLLRKNKLFVSKWALGQAELHNTLRAKHLCQWTTSRPSPSLVELYMYLDLRMHDYLCDYSPTSVYATSRQARFYRIFAEGGGEFVVDWLFNASEEEHRSLAAAMRSLLRYYESRTPDTRRYVDMIVPQDVSSVLAWLLQANASDRLALRSLFDIIYYTERRRDIPLQDLLKMLMELKRRKLAEVTKRAKFVSLFPHSRSNAKTSSNGSLLRANGHREMSSTPKFGSFGGVDPSGGGGDDGCGSGSGNGNESISDGSISSGKVGVESNSADTTRSELQGGLVRNIGDEGMSHPNSPDAVGKVADGSVRGRSVYLSPMRLSSPAVMGRTPPTLVLEEKDVLPSQSPLRPSTSRLGRQPMSPMNGLESRRSTGQLREGQLSPSLHGNAASDLTRRETGQSPTRPRPHLVSL
eukprot:Rmarinus@m.19029